MMEQNKTAIKQWFDSFNRGRDAALAVPDEVVTHDYVMHDPSGDLHGREALREFVRSLFGGLPDLTMALDEIMAEGDRLAYRFTVSGTHTGELMGLAATGKHVEVSITSMARFAGGKMAEEFQTWDFHGFLQQISSTELHKLLAHRFFEEVLNQRNWAIAQEICADDFVFRAWHLPECRGWQGLKQIYDAMDRSFSGIHYSIQEMIPEGERVIVHWMGCCTSVGDFMGFSATGKPGTLEGTTTLRMVNGKIVEHSGQWDAVGLLQSIGAWAIPEQSVV